MTPEQCAARVKLAQRSGFGMLRTPNVDDAGTAGCYYGGRPMMPADMAWPTLYVEAYDVVIPMYFLSRIDLGEMPDMAGLPDMPRHGALLVFMELSIGLNGVFGDDPKFAANGSAVRVIHLTDTEGPLVEREMPPIPDLDEHPLVKPIADIMRKAGVPKVEIPRAFKRWPFAFVPLISVPGPDEFWVENETQFIPAECREHSQKFYDAYEARIEAKWPEFSYYDRWRLGNGVGHDFLGASQSTSIPNQKFIDRMGLTQCAPIGDNDVILMVVSDINEIDMKISGGGPPYQIFIDQEDLRNGVFDHLHIWRATD